MTASRGLCVALFTSLPGSALICTSSGHWKVRVQPLGRHSWRALGSSTSVAMAGDGIWMRVTEKEHSLSDDLAVLRWIQLP